MKYNLYSCDAFGVVFSFSVLFLDYSLQPVALHRIQIHQSHATGMAHAKQRRMAKVVRASMASRDRFVSTVSDFSDLVALSSSCKIIYIIQWIKFMICISFGNFNRFE